MPLPPLLMLLITLHFYASGSHFIIIGDVHGVSKSSVSRAIERTTTVIAGLVNRYIQMPHDGQVDIVKRQFYGIARFPQVVGAIDCTHIRIQAPSVNEPDFVNRKGFHSVNIQVICDARYKILNLVSKWPGSVHDSRIFRDSQVCRDFEQGNMNGILVGDSGYPCRPYLMTPYLHPATQVQERFNDALTKTRVVVEQTFGIIKRRFPSLKYGLRLCPQKACLTFVACAVLHNFGLARGDIMYRASADGMDPPDGVRVDPTENGAMARNVFSVQHFS